MKRRGRGLHVDTFPFLAVLLCAMGSLILILLVIDRRAKAVAQAKALQEAAQHAEERAAQRRAHHQTAADQAAQAEANRAARRAEWERRRQALHAELTAQGDVLQSQLKTIQDKLSATAASIHDSQAHVQATHHQIEEAQQSLRQARQHLNTRQTEAAQVKEAAEKQSEAAKAELARLTAQLDDLERTLNELREARAKAQRTFSLVPYRGRRGDARRPLYIECTATGLTFHPNARSFSLLTDSIESIRTEVDTRIDQQRRTLTAAGTGTMTTPYLLLLVRPNGIESYYNLQRALLDRKLDFGYEFIEADWILDFPATDDAAPSQAWMASAPDRSKQSPPDSQRSGVRASARTAPGQPPRALLGSELNPADVSTANNTNGAGAWHAQPGGASGYPGFDNQGGTQGSPSSGLTGAGPAAGGPSSNHPGSSTGVDHEHSPAGHAPGGAIPEPGYAASQTQGGMQLSPGGAPLNSSITPLSAERGSGDGTLAVHHPLTPGSSRKGRAETEATASQGGGETDHMQQSKGALLLDGSPSSAGTAAGGPPASHSGNATGVVHELTPVGHALGRPVPQPVAGGAPGSATHSQASTVTTPGSTATSDPAQTTDPAPSINQSSATHETHTSGAHGPRSGGVTSPGTSANDGQATGISQPAAAATEPTDASPHGSNNLPPSSPFGGRSGTGRPTPQLPPSYYPDRDWVIDIDCKATLVSLRHGLVQFPIEQLANARTGANPLARTVATMVARRQESVRPGEPLYRPRLRFRVAPDASQIFYLVYPALEPLQLPMSRETLELER